MEERETNNQHSSQINEIIGAVPSWIVRWGITFFLIIVTAIFCLSTVIKYPEEIELPLKVVYKDPLIPIFPEVNGKIRTIAIKDGQKVYRGQVLATIQDADHPAKMPVLLKAAGSGWIYFTENTRNGQLASTGRQLFYFTGSKPVFICELAVSQDKIGKIKAGQTGSIRLKSYAPEVYGALHGRVEYVSAIAYRNKTFNSFMSIADNFDTGGMKEIDLKYGMTGVAHIVIREESLFKMMFSKLTTF